MDNSVITIKDLTVSYAKRQVLENVNLTVEKGDFIAIIGPNGAGKSTLIKCMMGLLSPTKGSISILGKSPEEGRSQIGYLAQYSTSDLDYPITVIDVILMSTLNLPKNQDYKAKARALLKKLGLEKLENRGISELSGGEKQRVFLARALLHDPEILILDEPTSNVDTPSEHNLYTLLETLKKTITIVIISHDLTAVSTHVNKIACLNKTLVVHKPGELCADDLEATYNCPIELIAHGVPHRVLKDH